jgi:hypothetical protein
MPTSTQLRNIWHTYSLHMTVLPSIGATRYHNYCIDGGTSPEYFGYDLVSHLSSVVKTLSTLVGFLVNFAFCRLGCNAVWSGINSLMFLKDLKPPFTPY